MTATGHFWRLCLTIITFLHLKDFTRLLALLPRAVFSSLFCFLDTFLAHCIIVPFSLFLSWSRNGFLFVLWHLSFVSSSD